LLFARKEHKSNLQFTTVEVTSLIFLVAVKSGNVTECATENN